MPELPEVEVMTQNLRRWTEHQHITLHLLDSKILKSLGSTVVSGQAGAAFRRGKYTILPVGPFRLVFHYRMTGKLVLGEQRPHSRAQIAVNAHKDIWFVDVRRFGGIWIFSEEELKAFWLEKGLGPEVYPLQRDGLWWRDQFLRIKAPIKNALLRQNCVAGLGNICASEICFRAKVAPTRPTHQLNGAEWSAISNAAADYLTAIIAEESGREIQYVTQGGQLPKAFLVYGRAGEPCCRCQHGIVRIVQAGRATFYCEQCTPTH